MATTLLTNQNKKTISLESKNHHGMFANIFLNINGGKKAHQLVFAFMNLLFSLVKINLS